MRSVLLYNLYPKSYWKELTDNILSSAPHDDIYVNVSLDFTDLLFNKRDIVKHLNKNTKIRKIFFTRNNRKLGEIPGFEKMRKSIDLNKYNVLTYAHSKGVTKPDNSNIRDWVEFMRYFIFDRFDLCLDAFNRGYILYGVNLLEANQQNKNEDTFALSKFHYSGTFVSVNLNIVREKFSKTPCINTYLGVEAFWASLCDIEKAFSAHNSGKNHYNEPFPARLYK